MRISDWSSDVCSSDLQVEAMTLADRIVVLNQGRIEQVGTPQHLYDRPATRFVAGFIGTPRMNLIAATVRAAGPDRSRLDLAGGAFLDGPPLAGIAPGAPIPLGIRTEHVAESGANARAGPGIGRAACKETGCQYV